MGKWFPALCVVQGWRDCFEGRLVNRGNGSYKGYPLEKDEWPEGVEGLYVET